MLATVLSVLLPIADIAGAIIETEGKAMNWKAVRVENRRAYLRAIGATPQQEEEDRAEARLRARQEDQLQDLGTLEPLPWLSRADRARHGEV